MTCSPEQAAPDRAGRRGVLVTRPEPGASDTARRVAALGWTPVLAPMLELRSRAARLPPPDAIQAVLVTSAAAIPALPANLHACRLLAVGDATAAAASAAGFAAVASAGADAAALLLLTRSSCEPGGPPLLLASAAGQGWALAAELRAGGFRVLRRSVYEARPVDVLPTRAHEAIEGGSLGAALFFSPATARAFVRAARRCGADGGVVGIAALAISLPTREALAPLPWSRIRVASRPNQDELLALLT